MSTAFNIEDAPPPPRKRGGPLGIYLTAKDRDRDAALGWGSLFFGILGQGVVYSPLLGKGFPLVMATLLLLVPWFIVFFLNFTNRPPLSPQATFHWWLFASCWYAAFTITAEVLYFCGYLPVKTRYHTSEDYYIPLAFHVLMHAGWLSFIPLMRYVRFHREQKI